MSETELVVPHGTVIIEEPFSETTSAAAPMVAEESEPGTVTPEEVSARETATSVPAVMVAFA